MAETMQGDWRTAFEHYEHDRLQEAYELAEALGLGSGGQYASWYRLVEAEWLTRRRSKRVSLTDWLEFEYIEAEVGNSADGLAEIAVSACRRVAERLGYTRNDKTLIAILAKEADAPWAANPWGYCADKYPFEKICLPHHLVSRPRDFAQAVAHEFAHVISLNLSLGRAPRWLEEAVSVLAEWQYDGQVWVGFKRGRFAWLSPRALEAAFASGDDEETEEDELWLAYQQAGWIGRYLGETFEEKRLGDLLREHTNESVWRNLLGGLLGRTRTEMAMQAVYGLSTMQVFARSLDYLKELPRP